MTPEDMAVRIAEIDQRSRSNTHRLDDAEKRLDDINRLTTAVEVMAQAQKNQTEDIKDIKTDVGKLDSKVDALEAKPGKRWDGLVDKLVLTLVAALVGFALARLGIVG